MPTGLPSKQVPGLDSRCCGLGYCLFGPFHLEDLAFYDSGHARNYFAPYNLLTEDTIPHILRSSSQVSELLEAALHRLAALPPPTPAAAWEKAVFEIHYRSFRALHHYTALASAKWENACGQLPDPEYQSTVKSIATAELENYEAAIAWHHAHPGVLGNPCHRMLGHFVEAWPDVDFSTDFLAPKRKSLIFLKHHFDPAEWIPAHFIQATGSDVCAM